MMEPMKQALLAVYEQNPGHWDFVDLWGRHYQDTWGKEALLCFWAGVECCNSVVRGLDFSSTPIRLLPDWVLRVFPDLEELNLRETQLKIHPVVDQNVNLKWLLLGKTPLITPPDLCKNNLLQGLELRDTKITIPPDVTHHPNLEDLDLSGTLITEPPNTSNNSNLKRLNLSRTLIMKAPQLEKNRMLEWIDIRQTKLSSEEKYDLESQSKKQGFIVQSE